MVNGDYGEATFVIVELPQLRADAASDSQASKTASRLRDLRLHALRTSPEAFATLYEDEEGRDLQHTLMRLTNDKVKHFVAIKQADPQAEVKGGDTRHANIENLLSEPWLGMIVLLGPHHDATEISARINPFNSTAESPRSGAVREGSFRFQLNGLFVDEAVRGKGVGGLLIDRALGAANKIATAVGEQLDCSVIVDKDNIAATALYWKSGFKPLGAETYEKRVIVENKIVVVQRSAVLLRMW